MTRRPLATRLSRAWREFTSTGSVVGRPAYKGAQLGRLNLDQVLTPLTADQELRTSLRALRARARDLARNDSYAKGFLGLLTSNVIGPTGVTSQAQVRGSGGDLAKDVNDKIDAGWADWAAMPVTLNRRLNLLAAGVLTLETVARDGEALVRMVFNAPNPHGFALQLLDADLLDETYNRAPGAGRNEIRMGVEVDANGGPVGYWLWELANITSTPYARRRYFAPAYDALTGRGEVLHLFVPRRFEQTRGPSWFHAVMDTLHQLRGYMEAELIGSRIGASQMGMIEPSEGAPEPSEDEAAYTQEMEVEPGVIRRLHAGEKFNPWSPEHPTTAFGPYVKTMLRDVATGLGATYFGLANDLEGVNYTSSRTGLLWEQDVWRACRPGGSVPSSSPSTTSGWGWPCSRAPSGSTPATPAATAPAATARGAGSGSIN